MAAVRIMGYLRLELEEGALQRAELRVFLRSLIKR
jgi:hypothetical protein